MRAAAGVGLAAALAAAGTRPAGGIDGGAAGGSDRPAGYLDGAPPGHTGGFGEPTCHRCHFDRPVDPAAGAVDVAGLPESFRPGADYRLEVRVTGPELARGGFQLSARCATGPREGDQAGEFAVPGDRAEVVPGRGGSYRGAAGVQYVSHTEEGTEPTRADTSSWPVVWTAPSEDDGPCRRVAVHVAANAADGDASEFGDRIYVEAFGVPRNEP